MTEKITLRAKSDGTEISGELSGETADGRAIRLRHETGYGTALGFLLSELGALRDEWDGDEERTCWVNAPLRVVEDAVRSLDGSAPIEAGERLTAEKALADAEEFVMGGSEAVIADPDGAVGVIDDLHDLLSDRLDAVPEPVEEGERFAQTPAIREVIATLDFVADRMDEHAYGEIRSAVESIPECETYTAVAHDEHEAEAGEREALIEQATWALIDNDTDTADRGVSDEHYRERRADVERVAPILATPVEAGEHEAVSGRRLILIQNARAEANYYRAFDDTEDLVGVLVEMAIMLEKDARRAPIEDAEPVAYEVRYRGDGWLYFTIPTEYITDRDRAEFDLIPLYRHPAAPTEVTDEAVRAGAFVLDEGAMDSPADYPLQAESALSTARDVIEAALKKMGKSNG